MRQTTVLSAAVVLAVPVLATFALQAAGSDDEGSGDEIAILHSMPVNPHLAQTARELIAEKIAGTEANPPLDPQGALAAKQASRSHSIKAEPWFKDGHAEDRLAQPERGIVNRPEAAPAPAMTFLATNHGTGLVGGRTVTVYAGTAGSDDPTTGAVWVLLSDADVTDASTDRMLRFDGTGALRVAAANGADIKIAGANGFSEWLSLKTVLPH